MGSAGEEEDQTKNLREAMSVSPGEFFLNLPGFPLEVFSLPAGPQK